MITEAGFEPVREAFEALLGSAEDAAAQFCGYAGGRLVVDLWGGPELDADTLLGLYSATKGAAAVCVALLVQDGALDLDAPVAAYWPEFAAGGKGAVTVRQLLSHQAGLLGTVPALTMAEVLAHTPAAERLAAQVPQWRPGSGHGYHAFTIGTLAEELVRRTAGRTIDAFFRERVAGPHSVDLHVAVPEAAEWRVLPLLPPVLTPAERAAARAARPGPGSLTMLAVGPGRDLGSRLLPNDRAVRAAGNAAGGGVASARGLARLYAACIGAVDGVPPLLSAATLELVTQQQCAGEDLVQGLHSRFAVLFQKPTGRLAYGSWRAFGHDGAGGAVGAADPAYGTAYGYTTRRLTHPSGADPRAVELGRLLAECAAR